MSDLYAQHCAKVDVASMLLWSAVFFEIILMTHKTTDKFH